MGKDWAKSEAEQGQTAGPCPGASYPSPGTSFLGPVPVAPSAVLLSGSDLAGLMPGHSWCQYPLIRKVPGCRLTSRAPCPSFLEVCSPLAKTSTWGVASQVRQGLVRMGCPFAWQAHTLLIGSHIASLTQVCAVKCLPGPCLLTCGTAHSRCTKSTESVNNPGQPGVIAPSGSPWEDLTSGPGWN